MRQGDLHGAIYAPQDTVPLWLGLGAASCDIRYLAKPVGILC